MLKRFLFGRGLNKAEELFSKAVRHGLGVGGGWLAATEYATSGQIDSIEAGVLTLASVLWSFGRTFITAKRKGE